MWKDYVSHVARYSASTRAASILITEKRYDTSGNAEEHSKVYQDQSRYWLFKTNSTYRMRPRSRFTMIYGLSPVDFVQSWSGLVSSSSHL
jgi:hypothetical protein